MKSNNKFVRYGMTGLGESCRGVRLMAIADNLRKCAKQWKNKVSTGRLAGYNSLFEINQAITVLKSTNYRLAAYIANEKIIEFEKAIKQKNAPF